MHNMSRLGACSQLPLLHLVELQIGSFKLGAGGHWDFVLECAGHS